MRSLRLLPILMGLSLFAVSGCRSAPEVAGASLECGGQQACPEGLRCINSLCLNNSPPVLLPLPPIAAVLGVPLTVIAGAEDANDDPISYSWIQIEGAEIILDEPFEGAELSFKVENESVLVLEATAYDGFEHGTPGRLVVQGVNTAPTVEVPVDDLYVVVGDDVELEAQVADADAGHLPTTHWEKLAGPAIDPAALVGSSILFVPAEVGVYRMVAVATDGYAVTTSDVVNVVALPAADAIFLSHGGTDTETCGRVFDHPCATLAGANAAMERELASNLIIANGPTPYEGCLRLAPGQGAYGGFEAGTWTVAPATSSLATLACDAAEGHSVAGDGVDIVVIADIALHSVIPSSSPTERVWTALTIDAPQSVTRLQGVNIEAASCSSCVSIGAHSIDSAVEMQGVNISASTADFTTSGGFVGAWVEGGRFSFTGEEWLEAWGEEMPRTRGDGLRGTVSLTGAVITGAIGIVLGNAAFSISRGLIEGGLGPHLTGIAIHDGGGSVEATAIDLRIYGTTTIDGIRATPCSLASWPWPTGVDPMLDRVCSSTVPQEDTLVLRHNAVELHGLEGRGFLPCRMTGVGLAARAGEVLLEESSISVVGSFAFGAGVAATEMGTFVGGEAVPGTGDITILRNAIEIAGGAYDANCRGPNSAYGTLGHGGFGMLLRDVRGAAIETNLVVVHAHEVQTHGAHLADVEGVRFAANRVFVKHATQWWNGVEYPLPAKPSGTAVYLTSRAAVTGRNAISRNLAHVASGVISASGLHIAGSDGKWDVDNNFLSTSVPAFGAGLRIEDSSSPLTPASIRLYHNTIFGGAGLVSRSAVLTGPGAGIDMRGNLFDAGDAAGRRFILDNGRPLGITDNLGNRGQFVSTRPNLAPSALFSVAGARYAFDNLLSPSSYWQAIVPASGLSITLQAANVLTIPALHESGLSELGGRILSFWRGAPLGAGGTIVAAVASSYPFTSADKILIAPLQVKLTPQLITPATDQGTLLGPTAAVLGRYSDNDARPDLGFIAAHGGAQRLFVMEGTDSGWDAVTPGDGGVVLNAPGTLGLSPDRAGGFLVDVANSDGSARVLRRFFGGSRVADVSGMPIVTPWGNSPLDRIWVGQVQSRTIQAVIVGSYSADLVLHGSGELAVYARSASGTTMARVPFVSAGAQACPGARVVAFDVALSATASKTEPPMILAGCSNGTLQIYGVFVTWSGASSAAPRLAAPFDTAMNIGTVGLRVSRGGKDADSPAVVGVVDADTGVIREFELLADNTLRRRISVQLLGDVPRRTSGPRNMPLAVMDGADSTWGSDVRFTSGSACTIASRDLTLGCEDLSLGCGDPAQDCHDRAPLCADLSFADATTFPDAGGLCVDAMDASSSVSTVDYGGESRPYGGGHDIGADERHP